MQEILKDERLTACRGSARVIARITCPSFECHRHKVIEILPGGCHFDQPAENALYDPTRGGGRVAHQAFGRFFIALVTVAFPMQ